MRPVFVLLLCVPLAGCYVKLHGRESTTGSVTATTTSSAVTGSARVGEARVSFSTGRTVNPGAPGGQVVLNRGASAVLVLGLVMADLLHYFSGRLEAKPQQPRSRSESIAETCSCYRKPVTGDQ